MTRFDVRLCPSYVSGWILCTESYVYVAVYGDLSVYSERNLCLELVSAIISSGVPFPPLSLH